jgi:glucokinase
MEIVSVDIGGTHARFAVATLDAGRVTLGPETVLKTSDYASLAEAWAAFAGERVLPDGAAIAVAGPVDAPEIKLTNNRWVLRPDILPSELGVSRVDVVNDFAAVAHAVPVCADQLRHVCGPDAPLPPEGVISVVGPGTGLGVAILSRTAAGDQVIASEGGHIGFAPRDDLDDRILARLRAKHGRVSVERVVCGVGLADIHAALNDEEADDRDLWRRALAGEEALAASLDRYCSLLGAAAGDLALAHGATGAVIAGGLGLRLAEHLPGSRFAFGFVDKGRFRGRMGQLPVKLIMHPQPGLLGAAAAFWARYPG